MATTPVMYDRLPSNTEAPGDLGGINKLLHVHQSAHGTKLPSPSDIEHLSVAFLESQF